LQRAAKGQLHAARIVTPNGVRTLPYFSGGLLDSAAPPSSNSASANAPAAPNASTPSGLGPGGLGCSTRNNASASWHNVRVNQDCTYRLQSEETIAYNPVDPNNLIGGMNDERQGYNLGAFAYSLDNGQTWGDGPPPFYQKINAPEYERKGASNPDTGETDPNSHTIAGDAGNGFTYDGGSDPMLTFDSRGRAFYGLVVFDRLAGFGSAVIVTQSPAGADGSFYFTPDRFSRKFVVVEDNSIKIGHDKPFLTADNYTNSPNRDNLYVTWTVFYADANGNYTQSPIFGSMSTDHALTWSTPELISGTSSTLCFSGNAFDPSLPQHSCNFDQGSDPAVLPNGELEVIFNNGNTAPTNPNAQQLGVHCKPSGNSANGTASLHCGAPKKVGDDVTQGEPQCDFGRGPEECIPGTYVRTDDYPLIAVSKTNGDLYATWQDYRTHEFDIQLSRSTDGGATWTPATNTVNRDRGTDHYEAAVDVACTTSSTSATCPASTGANGPTNVDGSSLCAPGANAEGFATNPATTGDLVAISYYRTCRIPNENTACPLGSTKVCAPGTTPGVQNETSDYSLVGGRGLSTPYGGHPVTPNFPPPRGGREVGFMGDYSGITVVGTVAHPIWADPRNGVPTSFRDPQIDQRAINDEDVFTVATRVPGS
jgi:hypothetical protein